MSKWFKVSPQENTSLRMVAKMYYNRRFNSKSWESLDYETQQVINMLSAMGFLEWEKCKGGSRLVECDKVNIVFDKQIKQDKDVYDMGVVNGNRLTYCNGNIFSTPIKGE